MKTRILVVDDEKTITDLVGIYLENEGFEVTLAYSGARCPRTSSCHRNSTSRFSTSCFPISIGFELLALDSRGSHLTRDHALPLVTLRPIRLRGLSLGADDYVVKPFRPLELVARAKAQLRRYTSYGSRDEVPSSHIISVHGLEINPEAHTVTVDDKPVRCTPIEYSILLYLAENRGRVVSGGRICSARCGTKSSCRARITP